MTTDLLDPADPMSARRLVESLDRRYPRPDLCTAPVLQAAADLLRDWWTTAGGHGMNLTGYQRETWIHSLTSTSLDMASKQVPAPAPQTPDEATALLDVVAARLGERGVSTSRDVLYVTLPRGAATPRWGLDGTQRLAITLTVDTGWNLVLDQPGASPVIQLVGRCSDDGSGDGIDAMLGLAFQVNAGAFGDILRF